MISIILPAYNEERNIGRMINYVSAFFEKVDLPYEIIVVDDGSFDSTREVIKNYETALNIIVVSHKNNLGYGSALRSGFERARGDLVFFTDSDCQFDISDITAFLDNIKENDFVIGYRKNRKDSRERIWFADIFNLVSRIFFGVKVKDVDCAFKLFKSYVLSDLNLISGGALINLEILAKAQKRGFKFIELPVTHFERTEGKQTGGSFKVIFKAISQFFLLWLNVKTSQKKK